MLDDMNIRLIKGVYRVVLSCHMGAHRLAKDGVMVSKILTEENPRTDIMLFCQPCYQTWRKVYNRQREYTSTDLQTFVLMQITAMGYNLSDLMRVQESAAFEHMAVDHGGE